MSLLRSLADRSARVPINMALLKELFASTCRRPSKAAPAPFPAPPSAVPLRRTGSHRTPQPRGNSGGSGVVSRSASACSRTMNLIVQRSKTAILPNMLRHNWLRISGSLRCFRWNGVLAPGHSSVRSAMFIAQPVLAQNKLRQERHGDERLRYRSGDALRSKHAAPDGACMVFRGSSAITMALLTELSPSPIPLKTAKNRVSHRGRYKLSTLSPPSLHALSNQPGG
jgi:hypothetical protein